MPLQHCDIPVYDENTEPGELSSGLTAVTG